MFYYEAYEYEFCEDLQEWSVITPELSFTTAVQVPLFKCLEGFDVATFFVRTNPECSPLSCNALAEKTHVNQHCLFNTFVEAKKALDSGFFRNSEPGPYRIFAVYSVGNLSN